MSRQLAYPNPANFYHLLGALAFLVLLAAVGIDRLRWRPQEVVVAVALVEEPRAGR